MKTIAAAAAVSLSLLLTATARAEAPPLASIRQNVHELEVRTKALRERAVRSTPQVRKESERILSVVDLKRRALATRIAILELRGADPADEPIVRDIEADCSATERLLGTVEGWFRSR